jgi:hypothetical protein
LVDDLHLAEHLVKVEGRIRAIEKELAEIDCNLMLATASSCKTESALEGSQS